MNTIRFSRGLRRHQVIVRGSGVMLVTLAFILLGDVLATAGSITPLAILLALLLVLVNLLGYVSLNLHGSQQGGAYVLVHESQGGALAFLTGWTLILSGLGLCVLLARGFGVQVVILLRNHLNLVLPVWPWAIGLVLILAVNNALGTKGSRRGSITAFLFIIILVLGFALLAAPQINVDNYRGNVRNWERSLTLLMAAFVGLEIAANLQDEVRDPVRSAPAILIAPPVLIAVVGIVIAVVLLGVFDVDSLTRPEYGLLRHPLPRLGTTVAGGAGRPFILVAGALGLALALNGTLVLVVRQIYAMGKDGYWPKSLMRMHPRFGTPFRIIALVVAMLLPLHAIPLRFLSRLVGLLYMLVLMAVNLAVVLRKQPESRSLPRLFHVWIPGAVLAIDGLVGLLWGPVQLVWAFGCLGVGAIVYLTYARSAHRRTQEANPVLELPTEVRSETPYRILVPIANPATAGTLLRLAGVLARQQGGEVLALQVVTVPDQVPLEEGRRRAEVGRILLERATVQAEEEGFSIHTVTRIAHSIPEGILDTAREDDVNLILLGWRGYTRSAGASMGPVIDAVIRDATCEVTVVKGEAWRDAGKILLPTAGGPHAPIAARLAMMLSEAYDSQVTAIYVQLGRATPEQMETNRARIAQTLDGLPFSHPPEQKVIVADSVVDGIAREAESYDLVLLGASEQGLFDQFVFGSIPQQIAARVSKTAVIVRRYRDATGSQIRRLIHRLVGGLPRLNVEEQLALREMMSDSARPGANFFVLIVLSAVIATLGLLLDSPAVVIGAMLVAPLMSPILGFSLGMVLSDVRLVRLSIESMAKGVALALLIAVLIGAFSPIRELTGEIMARTQPTMLDLVIALTSGMAGAYALSRQEVSAALPGVAIASALMPPLCVAGLGLSLRNPQVAGGAFLLFLANIAAISLAGVVIFIIMGVRSETLQPGIYRGRLRKGLIGFVLLLLVIGIPLAIIMAGILQYADTRDDIREVLTNSVAAQQAVLVDFEHNQKDERMTVLATVRSVDALEESEVEEMAEALQARLDRPVTLEITVLPVVRSDG
jgi:uncharacterized hydrophobic protein (TIGR00271 family)